MPSQNASNYFQSPNSSPTEQELVQQQGPQRPYSQRPQYSSDDPRFYQSQPSMQAYEMMYQQGSFATNANQFGLPILSGPGASQNYPQTVDPRLLSLSPSRSNTSSSGQRVSPTSSFNISEGGRSVSTIRISFSAPLSVLCIIIFLFVCLIDMILICIFCSSNLPRAQTRCLAPSLFLLSAEW